MKKVSPYLAVFLFGCAFGAILGLVDKLKERKDASIGKLNIADTTTMIAPYQRTVPYPAQLRDYQLEIVEDTIIVYDVNRCVGKFFWEDNSPLGQIILKDNE